MDTKRILITGIGGPTPRSIAVTLKNYSRYFSYELTGVDCDRLAIGLYQKNIFDKTYLVPAAPDSCYWEKIEEIIKERRIDIAIVQPELEVLEWSRRARGSALPCKVLVPEFDLVKFLLNKWLVSEFLYPLGFAPRSLLITRDKDSINKAESLLGYPFWVRGVIGSSGSGSLKVGNRAMLEGWLLVKQEVNEFLASSYLPGRNLACKLLYYNGVLTRSACAERINYVMSKVSPSGITGNTSFGRLLNDNSIFEVAREGIEKIVSKTGARRHGLFTVDLKEDSEGRPLITEINVRHIAFTSCFAAMGANLVEDSVRLLSGDSSINPLFEQYHFNDSFVFLRDIDALPVILKESQLY